MILGGLQKNSFIDYPGKVSCVLFLAGCNFDCPYCHNPRLAKGKPINSDYLDENDIYDFLEQRKDFLDAVVISGGEPTLQKDILSVCKTIKQQGYPVKLDTNGSRPLVIRELIDQHLIDYVAMDIKTDPLHYSPFIKKDYQPDPIFSSIEIILESGICHEFRTTCVKPFADPCHIESIARRIQGAMLYALQRFQQAEVLHPEFFKNNTYRYDDKEMARLKSIAAQWVQKCIIR
jgi:pyruvate formate lyase activating enzyme